MALEIYDPETVTVWLDHRMSCHTVTASWHGRTENLMNPSRFNLFLRVLAPAIALSVALFPSSEACTRVLWNNHPGSLLVGRTMDWPESTQPILTVFPRGMARDGSRLGSEVVVAKNGLRWTSKYGSLVTTVYGIGTADGFNERGLGAHMLYFNACDFGIRDTTQPGLQAGLWAQYLLDNAATVPEALALLEKFQLVMVEAHGSKATVHLAIEDAQGDSAIIEYIHGKAVVHHGKQFQLMTNDPSYDQQLELLKAQDFSKPSSTMPLPGNVNPADRFQRAAYYLAMLPKPETDRQGVASILSLIRNVSVPFGAPYKGFGIYNTEYRTVIDLVQQRYYFELSTSPSVVWVDLKRFDLSPGADVQVLNPDNVDLTGNVTAGFGKAPQIPF